MAFEPIEEGHVLAHIVQASARGSASFGSQHPVNAMALKDGLDGAFSKTQDLASAFRDEFFVVKGKPHRPRVLGHDQGNRNRPLSPKAVFRRECGQLLSERVGGHFHAASSSCASAARCRGSRIFEARKRTTGTATPSPER